MIYVPGLLVGQLSGKAGHTHASAGPSGTWLTVLGRHRAPLTKYSQSARASFSTIQKLFGTLDSSQIDAWETLGENIIITGRLGRNYTLTAASVFCQINRNLYTIGQPYVVDPPDIVYPADIVGFSADAQAPPTGSYELNLDLDPDIVPDDTYFVVYGQKPKNGQGLSYTKRGWKVLSVIGPGESNVVDVSAQYLTRFHGWFPLQTLPVKVIPVSSVGFQGNQSVAWALST